MYKCTKCGTISDTVSAGVIRCPSCANKMFFKIRQPIAKTIKAE
ncbi:MAG TPA: DNA-directed RNA polymerase subunit P [archaeon]|nr:DNA-directed RNA polymerase subunit P [archaeon]